jgi:bidirectional [NiFe] hydrogenase diaphorase subunit
MELTINGKKVTAEPGEFILQVARRNGIGIPTLCHHEGVPPWGGCRVCIVEISHPDWPGWSRIVTSCLYPAEDGLVVDTNSEKVRQTRAVTLDLLLARCPDSPEIQALARSYGIEETSFQKREHPDLCILCGLCVRVCQAVGAGAIATVGRGIDKMVEVPFESVDYAACIGCLACATNCPTHAIEFEETENSRTIWNRDFELVRCVECGEPIGTPQQLDFYAEKTGLPRSYFDKCEKCQRKEAAVGFKKVVFG